MASKYALSSPVDEVAALLLIPVSLLLAFRSVHVMIKHDMPIIGKHEAHRFRFSASETVGIADCRVNVEFVKDQVIIGSDKKPFLE